MSLAVGFTAVILLALIFASHGGGLLSGFASLSGAIAKGNPLAAWEGNAQATPTAKVQPIIEPTATPATATILQPTAENQKADAGSRGNS